MWVMGREEQHHIVQFRQSDQDPQKDTGSHRLLSQAEIEEALREVENLTEELNFVAQILTKPRTHTNKIHNGDKPLSNT